MFIRLIIVQAKISPTLSPKKTSLKFDSNPPGWKASMCSSSTRLKQGNLTADKQMRELMNDAPDFNLEAELESENDFIAESHNMKTEKSPEIHPETNSMQNHFSQKKHAQLQFGLSTNSDAFKIPALFKAPRTSVLSNDKQSASQFIDCNSPISSTNSARGTQFMDINQRPRKNPFLEDDADESKQSIQDQPKIQNNFDDDEIDEEMVELVEQGYNADINHQGTFVGDTKNDGNEPALQRKDYHFSEKMFQTLKNAFGIHNFRPNQLPAINAAMLGKDCFVLMPTGGGKSLCYQLTAAISSGVTIVISPLVSLIHDQLTKLKDLGIPSNHLSGGYGVETNSNWSRIQEIYDNMSGDDDRNGRGKSIKLLYVTPEKIKCSESLADKFKQLYENNKLERFVIDEAHCVSQWGHDFRKDYFELKDLRTKYPNVPLMALTATATAKARGDIQRQLKMRPGDGTKWFISSFNRSNLQYNVWPKKGKSITKDIGNFIKNKFKRQTGIVYCLSRNECDSVASDLACFGILAAAYHAGLTDNKRSQIQDDWIKDRINVIVATIAFGMGVDKPDVRFVIHYSIPKSIEGYYQESGRAGRDGRLSICILYYAQADAVRMRKLISSDACVSPQALRIHEANLQSIINYCENDVDCRRVIQVCSSKIS